MKSALLCKLGRERTGVLEVHQSVSSTNTLLKDLASRGAPGGSVVIALEQSAGRGRMGRSFFSPRGGLYISYLMRPGISASQSLVITGCAAFAVGRAIEDVTGAVVGIKWVNDILINGRKVCGILTECSYCGERLDSAVIGIGINVSGERESFPPELRAVASTLSAETGVEADVTDLASGVIRRLDRIAASLPGCEPALEYYRSRCVTVGKSVTVSLGGVSRCVFAKGVGEDFSLTVLTGDGDELSIRSGEASIRTDSGYA